MTNSTIGDVMSEGRNRALKSLAIFAGILVYLGMIAYSFVHNWSLMTSGIQEDMIIWAALGVICLEVSAMFLPVALHWWTHAPLQRFAALAFYGLDLALIFANVVLDYALVSQANVLALPEWLMMYRFYGVPATPVFCGLGWSLLFMLDPSQRERATKETLAASVKEVLSARIAQAAKGADIEAAVSEAAESLAREIIAQTLGVVPGHKAMTPAKATAKPVRSVVIDGINPDKLGELVKLLRSNGSHPQARVYESEVDGLPNLADGGEL